MQLQTDLKILLAMPSLNDGLFKGSVIAVVESNEDGDMGVILNLITETDLQQMLSLMQIEADNLKLQPIALGGPVSIDFFWAIHTANAFFESTIPINGELNLSSGIEVIKGKTSGTDTEILQIGLGYSGWGKNQLVQEIEEGSWWMTECPASLVFGTEPEKRWGKIFQHLGINPDTYFCDYDQDHSPALN